MRIHYVHLGTSATSVTSDVCATYAGELCQAGEEGVHWLSCSYDAIYIVDTIQRLEVTLYRTN